MRKLFLPLILLAFILVPARVFAADQWCVSQNNICEISKTGVVCKGTLFAEEAKCKETIAQKGPESTGADGKGQLPTQGNVVKLINPLGGTSSTPEGVTNLPLLLGSIIKRSLGVLGTVALLVFVYAGFQWVTAAGNADKISAGADAMLWSAIGICIIFSSYAILRLIFETLLGPGAFNSTGNVQNTAACYCTVDGKENVAVTDAAEGLTSEAACKPFTTAIQTKSGKTIQNCAWK